MTKFFSTKRASASTIEEAFYSAGGLRSLLS
jgi:hypothetical protein